jgi:hypothetical protein
VVAVYRIHCGNFCCGKSIEKPGSAAVYMH